MTTAEQLVDEPADAELISAVRAGDTAAYGELFARHVEAARRLARQLVSSGDVDDLVSEAFAKVLRVLQAGGGPDLAFRAYLLTAVRRLHVDRIRAGARVQTTDDIAAFDPGVPFRDTAIEGFENAAAARAFSSLPERWQLVLWHTEVEGQKPADIAPLLGMSANSVSALAYRAREGLRQAFLNAHAQDIDEDTCRWTHEHLGGYIRNGLSRRDVTKVENHLDECRRCMAIYLELSEVNSNLSGLLAPLLLGGAGLGYVASISAGAASKGAAFVLIGRARDWLSGNAATAAVAGVAATAVISAGVVTSLNIINSDAKVTTDPGRFGVVDTATAGAPASPGDRSPGSHRRHGDRNGPGHTSTIPPGAVVPPGVVPTTSSAATVLVITPGTTPVANAPTTTATSPGEGPTTAPTSPGDTPSSNTPGSDPSSSTATSTATATATATTTRPPTPEPTRTITPTLTPSDSTDPSPSDTTDPSPSDTTDPPPIDPTTTDPTTTPVQMNLAVYAQVTKRDTGNAAVTATVTGLATGQTATLTIFAEGQSALNPGPDSGCRDPNPNGGLRQLECAVTQANQSFDFSVNIGGGSRVVHLSVAPDPTATDPDQTDNSCQLTIDRQQPVAVEPKQCDSPAPAPARIGLGAFRRR